METLVTTGAAAAIAEPVIEVRDVTIGYDDYIVLENVSFHVRRGEVFVILGGSGCGKSTMLKHMIGQMRPMSGEILVRGHNVAEDDELPLARDCFGVLYQSGALFSSLTLEENVKLPIMERLEGLPRELASAMARVKLSLVGLEGFEDFLPSEISGGMRKRAGLARAMALDPEILFFDEPSAGLDPISSAELDALILELRDALGSTMVVVTHELDSIFSVADRAVMLDKRAKGIVAMGDPRMLRERSPDPWVKEFLNRKNMRG